MSRVLFFGARSFGVDVIGCEAKGREWIVDEQEFAEHWAHVAVRKGKCSTSEGVWHRLGVCQVPRFSVWNWEGHICHSRELSLFRGLGVQHCLLVH